MITYFKNMILNTWQEAEFSSFSSDKMKDNKFIDREVLMILLYIAFGLSVVEYYGSPGAFFNSLVLAQSSFASWFCSFFYGSEVCRLHNSLWWIATIVLFYLIFPILIIRFLFRKKVSDFGLRFKVYPEDFKLYVIMVMVMLPLVYYASSTASFQQRYPIFQPEKSQFFPLFIWWQIGYFLQFVAVEFFFRGFILHGLKYRFGFYAVFISTIPYCMVHFGKPFGETISAILAGIILGTISLKSRSIVLGVLVHYTVAISMDVFALYREGVFEW